MTNYILYAQHRRNEAKTASKYFVLPPQICLATLKDVSVLMTLLSPEAPLTIDHLLLGHAIVILTKNRKN